MREHGIKALRGYKAPRVIQGRPPIITSNKLELEFDVDLPDRASVSYLHPHVAGLVIPDRGH